ncbi:MAG: PIG-L family deacetylase [Actinomycetota bacterium]|nr:PIG-L family deacetylase [Actinomycetota bacterium]
MLALLAASGAQVDVVAVTDGEASHPGGSVAPQVLAGLRAAETAAALAALGVPGTIRRLRLPDGASAALEPPLVDRLRVSPGTWLLSPWAGDGHPDHEAVGRACQRVAARDDARLLTYPVWMWHWAAPGEDSVPWHRARRVDLPEPVRAAKRRALAAFATQTQPLGPIPADAPVLPAWVLERFGRPWEMVFG